ncbi:MAG: PKD domain-containing protein [Candidatus Thermoplasmatota archaeon]
MRSGLTPAFAFAFALSLALSGCIANAKDLKDKLTASSVDPPTPSPVVPVTPNTTETKPPVARISVFGANGALVFKASFAAEDVTSPVFVDPGVTLTLVATDSEALSRGATLAAYAWSIAGNSSTLAKTSAMFNDSGKYPVTLTVTDSNGLTDSQLVTLAIAPRPYDVTTNMTTGPVIGATGTGQDGTVSFDLSYPKGGAPTIVQGVKVRVSAQDTCDAVLSLLDKDGNVVGKSDKGGISTAEEIALPALPEGNYTVTVAAGDACVAKDGAPVGITVTYLPLLV